MNSTTAIDWSGFPTTLAIVGALTLLVLALKTINKMFPQLAERFKDMTPWMGWTEEKTDLYYYDNRYTRFPRKETVNNRW